MAERNWTREQEAAISCSADDILVSAGAGSGKTAVLTERIIRRLCDPTDPADITRMLIVTFTNAATEELRSRVAQALRARLAGDPGNRRLRRQLLLLPSARIHTISSFCLGIVRSNLNALGLPAGLRVCDEPESDLLAAEVMDQVIDGFYEGIYASAGDFGEFCDAFVSDRDDRLAPLFLSLYKKLREYVAGVGLLRENARALAAAASGGTDFMTTPWGRSIADELSLRLGYFISVLERALAMFAGDVKLIKAYSEQFAHDLDFARRLSVMLKTGADYATLRDYIGGYQSKKLGILKNYEKTPELEFYREVRSFFASSTGFVKKTYKSYFSTDIALLRQVLADCARQCENFYAVLSVFDERFTAEKRRRAIADYSDLERYAYKLLYSDDGNVSELARAVAAAFDELYIDEYQDTNELQDKIFAALAKAPSESGEPSGRVRFMVGDVKQSIYGFRGAEPSLFAAYRSDPAVTTLYLRTNFRSDRPVIDFANRISEHIFSGTGSEVEYGEGDRLVFGKTTGSKDHLVRVILFGGKDDDTGDSDTQDDDSDGIEVGEIIDPAAAEQKQYGEPEFVADEVARLIESGEYEPGDIAILLRSTEKRAEVYEKALRDRGIGATGGGTDFFARPEVSAMLCLLFSVGNPSRDIYLAGALRSPFFGFTFDDLIRIRRFMPPVGEELPFYFDSDDSGGEEASATAPVNIKPADAEGDTPPVKPMSLYEALVLYTKTTGFDKGRHFLDKLALYRAYAEANSADRVVRFIYRDIGAAVFAAGGGDPAEVTARKRSLTRLYELARTFEHGQFRGLASFIEYLEGLMERGSMEAPPPDTGKSGIRIMSIHKSKGLEFPVVFVCDCARRFNTTDTTQAVLFDPRLGAAAKLGDSSGFGRIDTPVRTATALRMTRRMKFEEMRALYVGMTRARERLYVTATLSDPEKLLDKAALTAAFLPAGARGAEVMSAQNFISWIAGALGGRGDKWTDFEIYGKTPDTSLPAPAVTGEAGEGAAAVAVASDITAAIGESAAAADEFAAAAGEFAATADEISAPAGEFASASGEIPAPAGEYNSTTGKISATTSESNAATGKMHAAAGEAVAVTGDAVIAAATPSAGAGIEAQPYGFEVEKYVEIFKQRLSFTYRWKPLEKLPAKLSVSKLYPSILDEGEGDGSLDLTEPDPMFALSPELMQLATGGTGDGKPVGRKFEPPRFLSDGPGSADAAERGTATHIFMQFCDFEYVERHGVPAELERLVAGRFMTSAHAALVDVPAVERFLGSPLYADMRAARELFREVRFNVRLPASEFTQDEHLRALLAGEPVLVQGVIDCYYETHDGALRLVDYKTDFIPPELRRDMRKAEELLIRRHSRQLGYYALAIEKLTGRPAERSMIYSFSLDKPIYIN